MWCWAHREKVIRKVYAREEKMACTPAWLLALSHLQQGSGLREYAAIIGEISGVGPQAWHWITHQSPAEAPSRGGQISNTGYPQPTLAQVCPAALLDQTPLIETVLFVRENVPYIHTR